MTLLDKDKVWTRIKKYIYIIIFLFIILLILLILLLTLNFIIYSKINLVPNTL